MLEIIILLFPSFIPIFMLVKYGESNLTRLVVSYPIYVVINIVFCFIITKFYIQDPAFNFKEMVYDLSFCTKYLILSCFLSYIFFYIKRYLQANIKVELNIRKEKTNVKNR